MNIPVLKPYTIKPIDVGEEGTLYVLRTTTGTFLKITEGVNLLLQEIDGKKNYEDISLSIREKYGHTMPPSEVEEIVVSVLGTNGLLENVEGEAKSNGGKLWIHFGLIEGAKFEKLCSRLAFLFNKKIMYFITFISVILIILSIRDFKFLLTRSVYSFRDTQASSWFILVLVILGMLLHELGHITAAFSCGIKPRKVGVGLYLLIPVLYTDLSEAWTLTRTQRLITDIGGIYFELLFLFLMSPMLVINHGMFNVTNFTILAQITLLTIFTNLNPLLKMDGYWILADYTGTINIHERTKEFFKNSIRKLVKSKKYNKTLNYKLTPATEKFFKFWAVGYTIITLWVLYLGIRKVPLLLKSQIFHSKLTIVIVVLAVSLQFLIPNLKNKIKFQKD